MILEQKRIEGRTQNAEDVKSCVDGNYAFALHKIVGAILLTEAGETRDGERAFPKPTIAEAALLGAILGERESLDKRVNDGATKRGSGDAIFQSKFNDAKESAKEEFFAVSDDV